MKWTLTLCFCLPHVFALAQSATVSGQVVDHQTGINLPGATILQKGTTNGVSSGPDGSFVLTVPISPDSIILSISAISFVTQEKRVAAGSHSFIQLKPAATAYCDLCIIPKAEFGLTSGLRYAPIGGKMQLFGSRFRYFPIKAAIGYQTNLQHNYTLTGSLSLPPFVKRYRLHLNEELLYQQLAAQEPGLSFRSYAILFDIEIYRIGNVRVPKLLLGTGYAQYRPLGPREVAHTAGYGYTFGLRHEFPPYPVRLSSTLQLTRWSGYWQWQGQLTYPIANVFRVGMALNCIRQYKEASLTLSRIFL